MTHRTHCFLRLGDNLAALQFLRALAKRHPERYFDHLCDTSLCDSVALREVVQDLPNVSVTGCFHTSPPYGSIDLWKGANDFWYRHPQRNDYIAFGIAHWDMIAARMGMENPIKTARDFLFDYPALAESTDAAARCDALVVNSVPLSGQWQGGNPQQLDEIVRGLWMKGMQVVTTAPCRFASWDASNRTVTEIGAVSRIAKLIVMISTGPSWCTFNKWTHDTCQFRLVLIDSEDLSGLACEHQDRYAQTNSIERAAEILKEKGWL